MSHPFRDNTKQLVDCLTTPTSHGTSGQRSCTHIVSISYTNIDSNYSMCMKPSPLEYTLVNKVVCTTDINQNNYHQIFDFTLKSHNLKITSAKQGMQRNNRFQTLTCLITSRRLNNFPISSILLHIIQHIFTSSTNN